MNLAYRKDCIRAYYGRFVYKLKGMTMKCKYRLTARGKSNIKLTLTHVLITLAAVVIIIIGFVSTIIAVMYPFADNTNDSIWIIISAWSIYILASVATINYGWKWLKENTEKC